LIRKYDSSGNLLWSKTYNGPDDGWDEALGIDVDASGNVVVVGYQTVGGFGGSEDFLIRKYDPGGTLIWTINYDSPDNDDDRANAVVVDSNGEVLVAGYETRLVPLEYQNLIVQKYSPPACLDATLATVPSAAAVSQWVNVVLTVTNTGGANAIGVTPALLITSGASLVEYLTGPTPAGPLTLAPGATQSFTWTYSASGNGNVAFTGTATGTDSLTGIPISAGASGILVIRTLEAAMSFSSNPILQGEWVEVVLTVTNQGTATVTGLTPDLEINFGVVTVDYQSGPTPGGPVTLASGAAQSFTWTYSVSGAGLVDRKSVV